MITLVLQRELQVTSSGSNLLIMLSLIFITLSLSFLSAMEILNEVVVALVGNDTSYVVEL